MISVNIIAVTHIIPNLFTWRAYEQVKSVMMRKRLHEYVCPSGRCLHLAPPLLGTPAIGTDGSHLTSFGAALPRWYRKQIVIRVLVWCSVTPIQHCRTSCAHPLNCIYAIAMALQYCCNASGSAMHVFRLGHQSPNVLMLFLVAITPVHLNVLAYFQMHCLTWMETDCYCALGSSWEWIIAWHEKWYTECSNTT